MFGSRNAAEDAWDGILNVGSGLMVLTALLTANGPDVASTAHAKARRLALSARVGCGVASLLAGWARVEAKKHYPSDTLVGIAPGNFVSAFVNDALIELHVCVPKIYV